MQPIDWVAGLLALGGFGFTLVGFSLAAELGWWVPKGDPQSLDFRLAPFGISIVPVLIASGLICLGLLAFWERQRQREGQSSLLRMGVFNRRIYTLGLTIGTLHTMLNVGTQFNLFQFIPAVVGLNPIQTAIAVMPFTITQLVVLIRLAKRRPQMPHRLLLQVGLGVKAFGIFMLFLAITPSLTGLSLMPSLIVMGAGTGLFATYITSLTFDDTHDDEKPKLEGYIAPFKTWAPPWVGAFSVLCWWAWPR
ncbi:MAG: MFS transporter [Leptolyngbyaceae cyanobacterium SM2_5_2]|nr:MFS transporter [Leptolyngbyaceae cyanobacterium SM2_5_2]